MPNKRLHADAQTYAAFVGFAALHFTTKASPVWALVSRALGVIFFRLLFFCLYL